MNENFRIAAKIGLMFRPKCYRMGEGIFGCQF